MTLTRDSATLPALALRPVLPLDPLTALHDRVNALAERFRTKSVADLARAQELRQLQAEKAHRQLGYDTFGAFVEDRKLARDGFEAIRLVYMANLFERVGELAPETAAAVGCNKWYALRKLERSNSLTSTSYDLTWRARVLTLPLRALRAEVRAVVDTGQAETTVARLVRRIVAALAPLGGLDDDEYMDALDGLLLAGWQVERLPAKEQL